MGEFILNPKFRSSITMNLSGSSPSSKYVVAPVSLNMNESRRLQVLYASEESGGSAIGFKYELVPLTFVVVVFGTTHADAMNNFRTLLDAVTNKDGGTLQYIPTGLTHATGTIMETYYHYLPSPPPKILPGAFEATKMQSYGQAGHDDWTHAITCEVELTTQAIATNRPWYIGTPATDTIYCYNDTTHDNFITLDDDDVDGDFIIPRIYFEGTGVGTKILMYVRKMVPDSPTAEDYLEAESSDLVSGFSTGALTGRSNGSRRTSTGATGYLSWYCDAMDYTYIGKIVPWIVYRITDASTTWKITPRYRAKWTQEIVISYKPITVSQSTTWACEYKFEEMDLPPWTVSKRLTTTTTPTLSDYSLDNLVFELYFERTAGSGTIEVDYVILAKADEFIAYLTGPAIQSNHDMEIEAFTGMATTVYYAGDEEKPWKKYGSPYSSLWLKTGWDYRFHFMWNLEDVGATNSCDVTIWFLQGTVFPFEDIF